MLKGPVAQLLPNLLSNLSTRTKGLVGLWLVFVLLVAFGIHGSATGVTAQWWARDQMYDGYLFSLPHNLTNIDLRGLRELLMADARGIRWDELLVVTPLALSQLSHRPKFPVVNKNIGNGQNMLLTPHVPVLHITTLARPATWGYFFLGAQRGLAWYWWFGVFACFTALYLLLEIILKGRRGLAAFGSFWFCSSAYVVCWSLWPAHLVFFGALACLSAYHLLASSNKNIQILSGILLGISIPGVLMFLYPPWQLPVGYLFLIVFVGLVIRDKLYRSFRPLSKYRLISLTAGMLLAAGLSLSFLLTCLPDLKVMANTVYPGKRVSLGGDYSFAMLFKGIYNLITIYSPQTNTGNQSEASSFYYFFPAVFLTIALSRRLITRLGIVGWALIFYLVSMLVFLLIGFPYKITRLTLMSYVPPYRADIAIGLASILLCMLVLSTIQGLKEESATSRWHRVMPIIIGVAIVGFFLVHGLIFMKMAGGFPPASAILLASTLAGFLSYSFAAGNSLSFCGALGAILVATTAFFNPLATNLDHIYRSELAQQIVKLNSQSKDPPLWIAYGGVHPGVLILTLGARSLTGVHWPPQLGLWRSIDPTGGGYESVYNRYAQIQLSYRSDNGWVSFNNFQDDAMMVKISPTHPALRALGARYVLALDEAQAEVESSSLPRIYKSENGAFSIFEIPNLDASGASAGQSPN